jgi:hypothetical protein
MPQLLKCGRIRMNRKLEFIIQQEKLANNSWKWIKNADEKTINELYEYWTQEEDPNE